MGADMLGHIESPLKSLIQTPGGMPVLQRKVIRFLELTKNLGFAQDHGIEPAGDAEKVLHALRLAQRVNLVRQRVTIIMAGYQEFLQRGKGLARLQGSGRINLHSITGGQNYRFIRRA